MPWHPTDLDNSRQGPTVLSVDAGGGYLDTFFFCPLFLFLSPSLWETP